MLAPKTLWIVLVCAVSLSCGGGAEPEAEEPAGSTEAVGVEGTPYEGVGTIVEIRDDGVVIDHDPIPGFMDAMTMTYPVSDPALLDPFEEGMVVSFRVVVNGSSYVIDRIEAGARRQGG